MRVLIADDDEIALIVLKDALTEAGHEVHTASNGARRWGWSASAITGWS